MTTTLILGILLTAGAGHVIITKILPRIKTLLLALIKDEKAVSSVMYILIAYVGIFILDKILGLLSGLGNPSLNDFVAIVSPAVEIFLKTVPYVQWIVAGTLLVLGLKVKR